MRRQKIIERIIEREVWEFIKEYGLPPMEESKEYPKEYPEQESEILFLTNLRRKRERADIVPLSKLTRRASMFLGGSNYSQPHEEAQYWNWVDEVKDVLFVFEGQDKEIYTLPADSLWYMGNKSARGDRLLGTRFRSRRIGGVK